MRYLVWRDIKLGEVLRMNKLNVFESLNNVITKEQNTSKLVEMRRDFILSEFYREGKYFVLKDTDMDINFWDIYIPSTSYLNGKIQTKYHVDIDVSDIVNIKYKREVKLKLTHPDFLNVGRKEIWKVGGIKKINDKNTIDSNIVDRNDDNIMYQNRYDFKINGWKIPRDSFLTLTDLKSNSKKNILCVLVRYRVYMFLKFDEIFSLERC